MKDITIIVIATVYNTDLYPIVDCIKKEITTIKNRVTTDNRVFSIMIFEKN